MAVFDVQQIAFVMDTRGGDGFRQRLAQRQRVEQDLQQGAADPVGAAAAERQGAAIGQ